MSCHEHGAAWFRGHVEREAAAMIGIAGKVCDHAGYVDFTKLAARLEVSETFLANVLQHMETADIVHVHDDGQIRRGGLHRHNHQPPARRARHERRNRADHSYV